MEKKRKFEFPHTVVIMIGIVLFLAILTWIIPPGMFETQVIDGKTQYIAGSYHIVERTGQGPWDIMMAFAQGFTRNAAIFFMIFTAGGAVHMLEQTGCLTVIFKKFSKLPASATPFVVGIIMLSLSLVGSTGAFSQPVLALMPIGVMLAGALGLDKACGFILIFFGSFLGYNTGATNVFTVGIAQTFAELPAFSGMELRFVFHAVNFILTYGFSMIYINKIRKNPLTSLNYAPGVDVSEYMGVVNDDVDDKLTVPQLLSFLGFVVFVVSIVVGTLKAGWGNTQFTAGFIALSIYLTFVNRIPFNAAVKQFAAGCASMTSAVLIVGFAGGIPNILEAGTILHTIVHWLSIPISMVGSAVGAVLMFFANLIINFFIPSSTGQAAAVMPILIPIADLCGITRQVAVQCFQFGDAVTNNIIPTSGTLLGCLAMAGIPYPKYLKWYAPLFLLQFVLFAGTVYVLQTIGWMG